MGVPKHEFDIDALAPNAERPGGAGSKVTWQAVLICFALFAVAPLFAVLTWQESYTFLALRHYSVVIWAAQLIVACLVIVSGVRVKACWDDLTGVAKIALIVFLSVAAFAAWSAPAMPSAALTWFVITLVQLAFLAACYHAFANNMVPKSAVLWSLAGGAAVYFFIAYGLALTQRTNPDFEWTYFGPGVSHIRQLGYYGLVAAGISAGFLAVARDRKQIVASHILLTIGAWCVFTSGGRASTGALVVAIVAVLVLMGRNGRLTFLAKSTASLVAAAMASLMFVPSYRWGIESVLGRLGPTGDGSGTGFTTGRTHIWGQTWEAILERPFIGHGQGQFRFVIDASLGRFNHPHNAPLQFLLDWGLIGSMALLVLGILVLMRVPRALREDRGLALPAIGVAAGLLAMSMLDGALYYPYPIMAIMVACAVVLSTRTGRTSYV